MGDKGMKRSTSVASMAAIAVCAFASAADASSPCPDRLDGKFKDAHYEFSYESTLSKKQTGSDLGYEFGGSISNSGPTAAFFSWKEMDLSGFVPTNKMITTSIGDPIGECDVVDADIWYGDGPFLFSKVSAIRPRSKNFGPKLVQIVTDKILEYFKRDGKVYTTSDSTIYVPLDQEATSKEFARFRILFYSQVSAVDYQLSISMSVNSDDKERVTNYLLKTKTGTLFKVVFDDAFLAQAFKKSELLYTIDDLQKAQPAHLDIWAKMVKPEVEAYRTTRLIFEDTQRRRIGSIPVAILQPASEQPNNR